MSEVWSFFTKEVDGARCTFCSKSFAVTGSSTSSLLRHLKAKHPAYQKQDEDQVGKTGIKPYLKKTLPAKFRQDVNAHLVRMIAGSFLSLRIVDQETFKAFVNELNPHYEIPSRRKIVKLLKKEAEGVEEKRKQLLRGASHVVITTDAWSSPKNAVQLTCITTHFVKDGMNRVDMMLECFEHICDK